MNIDISIHPIRKEQASKLGIDHKEYECIESLENAIANKLAEGMEPLIDIIQSIDEIENES
ncbi:MAG: hypothetical protein U9Q04_03810 [Campylobacterota bacterium]|nr:hypothetical protein [Campylobacterota bacterium]